MKKLFLFSGLFSSVCFLASMSVASAAVYSATFEPPAFVDDDVYDPLSDGHEPVAGQDGWYINDNSVDADAASPTGYLHFLVSWDSGFGPESTAAGFGGYMSYPAQETSVRLGRGFNGGAVASGSLYSTFAVDFAVILDDPSLGPDSFGWQFLDDTNNVFFSLDFIPRVGEDALDVVWSDGVNTTVTGSTIGYDSSYQLSVKLTENGSDLDFELILQGQNAINLAGSLSGAAGVQWGGFEAKWDITDADPANAGYNYLVFDNLTVASAVPEPGAAMLLLAGAAGFWRRRRSA